MPCDHLRGCVPLDVQIYVFFPPEVKVGVKNLKSIFEKMKEGGVKRAMLVLQTNLTHFSKNTLEDMAMHGYLVEVFQVSRLRAEVALRGVRGVFRVTHLHANGLGNAWVWGGGVLGEVGGISGGASGFSDEEGRSGRVGRVLAGG